MVEWIGEKGIFDNDEKTTRALNFSCSQVHSIRHAMQSRASGWLRNDEHLTSEINFLTS
jgi:hypothetical protein